MKPKKPIRRVSKNRAVQLREYTKLRTEFLREHFQCEICRVQGEMTLHHKKGRGIHLCNPEYFMSLCFWCHRRVETQRAWAMEKGYLLDRIGHD